MGTWPDLWNMFWTDPILWWQFVHCPFTGNHSRLVGPGKKSKKSIDSLMMTPKPFCFNDW
eukprot:UN15114